MDWIVHNMGSIVVGVLLLALVGVIVYKIGKDKRAGKSSCGCGCSGCPMSGKCHENNK